MEKLTKEDLKGPDAFQSSFEIISEFFFHHRMTIIGTIAGLILAGIVWAALGVYNSNVEEKAQEALFIAEKKLDLTNSDFEKLKNPQKTPSPIGADGKKKTPDQLAKETAEASSEFAKLVKPTGDFNTDYKESLPLLKGVVERYPKSQAAVIASLDLSKIYQNYKQYDPQIDLLKSAASHAQHPVTKGLTLNRLAMAYEGKGDCPQAVATWQKIEDSKELSFLAGKSLINMGLCFEKLHQNDKAEQSYLKAEGLVKDGDTAKTAKKYLRLLKRDQKS
jgi:tetratricopeptide (TPR) repeat protein